MEKNNNTLIRKFSRNNVTICAYDSSAYIASNKYMITYFTQTPIRITSAFFNTLKDMLCYYDLIKSSIK